ncbi:MAG: hypothetical protein ACXAEN_20470 [Candidatus Thorarchaeota archaeon]|jgi:hypothetical protein
MKLNALNVWISAIERMLATYEDLKAAHPESIEYIEERQHFLNCAYAEFLLDRDRLRKAAYESNS